MTRGARTNVLGDVTHSNCFLTVEPSGLILMDRKVRLDLAGLETWKFEYLEDHVRVRQLYPSRGGSIKLHIDRHFNSYLQMKRNRPLSEIFRTAKHEAGHALLCYALRLCPVHFIDLRVSVIISGGNLHAQIENREPVRLTTSRGSTSMDLTAQDVTDTTSIQLLASACQSLGGIAGCRGDENGAGNDLEKFYQLVTSIPELDCASEGDFDRIADRLRAELQILANQIIAEPVVVPRHEILAETLFEDEYLDRVGIENILDPATLPDYSGGIGEIGKRFNIPVDGWQGRDNWNRLFTPQFLPPYGTADAPCDGAHQSPSEFRRNADPS